MLYKYYTKIEASIIHQLAVYYWEEEWIEASVKTLKAYYKKFYKSKTGPATEQLPSIATIPILSKSTRNLVIL